MEQKKQLTNYDVARRLAIGVYAIMALAVFLTFLDRMPGKGFEKFLSFTLLLSIIYLFAAVIWVIIRAESGYTQSAMAQAKESGSNLVVLGGGVMGVVAAMIPVAKIFEGAGRDVARISGFWQVFSFCLMAAALFVINEVVLARAYDEEEVSGQAPVWARLVVLVPLAVLAALWMLALAKAMIAYGMDSKDAWWLKMLMEAINFLYVCALGIGGCMIHWFFLRPLQKP